jgi:hypothetical protein
MTDAADLRRHAARCRFLADYTVSWHDKEVLLQSADEFDAEAKLSDEEQRDLRLHRIVKSSMTDDTVHSEPSSVKAHDGHVHAEGPDAVDVHLTPEAAEETADRLTNEAVVARGQRRLNRMPHRGT